MEEWPLGKFVGHFLDDLCWDSQLTKGGINPRQLVVGYIWELGKQASKYSSVTSVSLPASWFLF